MLKPEYAAAVAANLALKKWQAEVVIELLNEGATIPFIARYRKDKTGNLDEVALANIEAEVKSIAALEERRSFIESAIRQQEKWSNEVEQALKSATTLTQLEDIYLPYKPKRQTRAQVARQKGLEPLATKLLQQANADVNELAATFISDQVATVEEALQGARDIVAEHISEDALLRAALRRLFEQKALLKSEILPAKENEAQKYKDYFAYSEPAMRVPAHRALAVMRGFMEGLLRMSIVPLEEEAIALIEQHMQLKQVNEKPHLQKAAKDAYRRLLEPAMETEMRNALKLRSDEEAINVFAENLRQLLLGSPLGSKRLIAIDPGYRTGCKTVMLGAEGQLLDTCLIYVHEPARLDASRQQIEAWVKRYNPEAFAIGDGTAGRETEKFIRELNLNLPLFMVNEDVASVYSASEVAREEFPNQDITVRGAVSIGRRLMDPLAELVKIDPKSIGVGQYQHDVNQTRLKEKLDATVISVVNQVGVNLNTASQHLLAYVSGIGDTIARNLVQYRNEHGAFLKRSDLKKVARLGDKAFEQCAGFLRIANAKHPLDASGVHPESYGLVEQMAADAGVPLNDLVGSEKHVALIDEKKYAQHGAHTVKDILRELRKPGLDPRSEATAISFAAVYSLNDLYAGMQLPGIVTNLTRFGAFVDVGVKQDGLVHISEIAHRYISDPAEVLQLGQHVQVKVVEVDSVRNRIALSIKQTQEAPQTKSVVKPKPQQKESSSMEDALQSLKRKFGR